MTPAQALLTRLFRQVPSASADDTPVVQTAAETSGAVGKVRIACVCVNKHKHIPALSPQFAYHNRVEGDQVGHCCLSTPTPHPPHLDGTR